MYAATAPPTHNPAVACGASSMASHATATMLIPSSRYETANPSMSRPRSPPPAHSRPASCVEAPGNQSKVRPTPRRFSLPDQIQPPTATTRVRHSITQVARSSRQLSRAPLCPRVPSSLTLHAPGPLAASPRSCRIVRGRGAARPSHHQINTTFLLPRRHRWRCSSRRRDRGGLKQPYGARRGSTGLQRSRKRCHPALVRTDS
jgi:hypothetical protein